MPATKKVSKRLLTLAAASEAFDATPGLVASFSLRGELVGSAQDVHTYLAPWRGAGCKVTVTEPRAGVVCVLIDGRDG